MAQSVIPEHAVLAATRANLDDPYPESAPMPMHTHLAATLLETVGRHHVGTSLGLGTHAEVEEEPQTPKHGHGHEQASDSEEDEGVLALLEGQGFKVRASHKSATQLAPTTTKGIRAKSTAKPRSAEPRARRAGAAPKAKSGTRKQRKHASGGQVPSAGAGGEREVRAAMRELEADKARLRKERERDARERDRLRAEVQRKEEICAAAERKHKQQIATLREEHRKAIQERDSTNGGKKGRVKRQSSAQAKPSLKKAQSNQQRRKREQGTLDTRTPPPHGARYHSEEPQYSRQFQQQQRQPRARSQWPLGEPHVEDGYPDDYYPEDDYGYPEEAHTRHRLGVRAAERKTLRSADRTSKDLPYVSLVGESELIFPKELGLRTYVYRDEDKDLPRDALAELMGRV